MLELKSASGTTGVINKDIWTDCRNSTWYNGKDDQFYPFRIKQLDLRCSSDTVVTINGNTVALDEDPMRAGWHSVGIPRGSILIKSMVIATNGTQWEATFLF